MGPSCLSAREAGDGKAPATCAMSLVATTAATAIAAASAAAAVGTFFVYFYFVHRSEAHAAREEAMDLAETRGAVIGDLRRSLRVLERQLEETTRASDRRIRELEAALQKTEAEARENAYRIQRFYATSLADLLRNVEADLDRAPPNVENALARVRHLIDGERPAA
jgi:Skp family chaperone for outer membrane proteins